MLIHCEKCGRLLDKPMDNLPDGFLINLECRKCRHENHVSVKYRPIRVKSDLTTKKDK